MITITSTSLESPLALNYGPYDLVSTVISAISAETNIPVNRISLYYGGLISDPTTPLMNIDPRSIAPHFEFAFTMEVANASPVSTNFLSPTTISNVTIPNSVTNYNSIDWIFNPTAIAPGAVAVSSKRLYTISGLWMEQFLSNTSQLWCTGYNFSNITGTVTGIEFQLNIYRQSRIEDLVIQLTLGGELIGENLASKVNPVQSDTYTGDNTTPIPIGDNHIYGGPFDMWGTTLTAENILDPTFGIVISFRSNAIYPHNDLAYVDQASIRITYA